MLALPWSSWKEKLPEFISPLLWSPNSLDLHPVDCSVRAENRQLGILQVKVYRTRNIDLDDLKHRIRTEWTKLDCAVIAAVVHQWRRRLSACVRAGGDHFERCF